MSKTATPCAECESHCKSIFCDLPEQYCEQIDAAKTLHVYKAEQIIFHQGTQPFGLYCVQTGKIKIYATDNEGNQQVLRIASAGDIVGYRALLLNQPYIATAETLVESRICFIHREPFLRIIHDHQPTNIHLMQIMAQELGHTQHQLLHMAHKKVRERLAELLLEFKDKHGVQGKNGYWLDLQLSRQALADFIGTTQESVIRLLGEFKQDGIILDEGKHLVIVDV